MTTETLAGIESLDPTLEDIRLDPSPEFLSALGSLSVEDPLYQVTDTFRYAQKYYNDDEDVRKIRQKLRGDAIDRHTLALIELGRVQLGHYSVMPVMPAAAYAPLLLGEGPGYQFAHDLKAANYELEPIKNKKTGNVSALRLIPRRK